MTLACKFSFKYMYDFGCQICDVSLHGLCIASHFKFQIFCRKTKFKFPRSVRSPDELVSKSEYYSYFIEWCAYVVSVCLYVCISRPYNYCAIACVVILESGRSISSRSDVRYRCRLCLCGVCMSVYLDAIPITYTCSYLLCL